MAKNNKDESKDVSYAGCYGEKVTYEGLRGFLDDAFASNVEAEDAGSNERFATCVWGHSGIGKTGVIKQQCNKPVVWNGKEYPGYAVYDVPIAQFEEMGDLHGMPSRHVRVTKEVLTGSKKSVKDAWVPEEVIQAWVDDGWDIDREAGIKTMYAPPDWVPTEPGPSILLLDDWNRASVRIIKGIMQLLQNYGMVSWKLPKGCNIVLTANPDEQEYLVTSLDSAILTRIRSVTLKHDVKEWSVWAQANKLDSRGISYLLQYPEMMIGPERTNPRTLAQCFRDMRRIPDLKAKSDFVRMKTLASSLLDDQTVSSMIVFMERDVELILEPERILAGRDWTGIEKHMNKLVSGAEKRIDVLGVMCDRLYAHLVQPETKADAASVDNFQRFLTMSEIPEDLRHSLCLRLSRVKDGGKTHKWILHNDKLTKAIMAVV